MPISATARARSSSAPACQPATCSTPRPRSTNNPSAPLMKTSVTSGSLRTSRSGSSAGWSGSRRGADRVPTSDTGAVAVADPVAVRRPGRRRTASGGAALTRRWTMNGSGIPRRYDACRRRGAARRRSVDSCPIPPIGERAMTPHPEHSPREKRTRREKGAASHRGEWDAAAQCPDNGGGVVGTRDARIDVRPRPSIRIRAGALQSSGRVVGDISSRSSPTIGGSARRRPLATFPASSGTASRPLVCRKGART